MCVVYTCVDKLYIYIYIYIYMYVCVYVCDYIEIISYFYGTWYCDFGGGAGGRARKGSIHKYINI